jgi:hypothetical protein
LADGDDTVIINFADEYRIFERKASNIIVPEPRKLPLRPRNIEQLKYKLLYPKSENVTAKRTCCSEHQKPFYLLDDEEDDAQCSIASLREAKKKIKQELKAAKERLETIEDKQSTDRCQFIWHLGAPGISLELYEVFESFCDSLDSEVGQRGGFSVTYNVDYQQNYIQYDPKLELIKKHIEMPYAKCNFRCEASVVETKGRVDGEFKTECVVEFWPLEPLEPLNGTAKTWGEQYVRILHPLSLPSFPTSIDFSSPARTLRPGYRR